MTDSATTGNTGTETSQSTTAGFDPLTDGGMTAGTTGSSGTSGTTGTDPGGGDQCPAFCEKAVTCDLGLDAESCAEECDYADFPGACHAATAALYACMAALECPELESSYDSGNPCTAEWNEQAAQCEECGYTASGDNDGTSCDFSYDCSGEPVGIRCDTETCVCFEGDMDLGSCPAEAICEGDPSDIQGYVTKAESCCGIDLPDP